LTGIIIFHRISVDCSKLQMSFVFAHLCELDFTDHIKNCYPQIIAIVFGSIVFLSSDITQLMVFY